MSNGPWEDFGGGSSSGGTVVAKTSGPWDDFKVKGNTKTGPWDDFKSDAQNMGMTGNKTVFGSVTKGREPGVEPMGIGALAGEMVRRTLNLPLNLFGKPDMFPPGASLLPAEGLKQLLPFGKDDPGENPLQGPMTRTRAMLAQEESPLAGVVIPGIATGLVGLQTSVDPLSTKPIQPPAGIPSNDSPSLDFLGGVATGGLKSIEQLATPENVAIAGGIALAPQAGLSKLTAEKLALSYFFPQIFGKMLPEQAGQASVTLQDPNASPADKGTAVGEVAGTGVLGLGLTFGREGLVQKVKEAYAPEPRTGITPEMNPSGAAALLRQFNPPKPMEPTVIPPSPGGPIPLPRTFPQFDDLRLRTKEGYQGESPIIGQRPLSVQQPVISPYETKPTEITKPSSDLPPSLKPTPQSGQISFEGQGIPSSGQSARMVPENTIQSQGQLSGRRTYSGIGDPGDYNLLVEKLRNLLKTGNFQGAQQVQQQIEDLKNRQQAPGFPPSSQLDVKKLRPAIDVNGRILIGEQGETHADVLSRNGINPDTIPHQDARRGFVDVSKPTELINRRDAERRTGLKGTADAGGLDSMDLPGSAEKGLKDGQREGQIKEKEQRTLTIKDHEGRLYSGVSIDPEDIKRAVKSGANFAMGKIRKDAPESTPKFIYRITSKGEAEEITDQYELAHAIGQLNESHYWAKPDGELVKGTGQALTHYLAAKKILGEKVIDTEGSDLRDVYKKMRGKGWARVLEQEDKVFIKGQANQAQIDAAVKLAEKDGKQVWHNDKEVFSPEEEARFNEDEQAGGTLEESEDSPIYPDDPQDHGTTFYSGIPVVDTVQKMVDHIMGRSVNRKVNETMKYYSARAQGYSAPRTSSANADVGNNLIRAAAADVALGVAKAGPVVIKGYKDKVAQDLYDSYISSGLGKEFKKGSTAPATMKLTEIGHKPIWLRKDLVPELTKVFDKNQGLEGSSLFHYMLDLATEVQLVGPTDLMFHTANMLSSISYSLGKGSDLHDVLLNLPGVGTVDAISRVAKEWQRVKINDPAVQRELVGMAKIGALRGAEATGAFNLLDWGKFIQKVDRAGRLARNGMWDNLVERKLVKDSEQGRREFINKMGQYNDKLMGQYQSFFRKTFSPFVVAGRTFNRNALENLVLSNPGKEMNPGAYAKMKAIQFVNLTTAAVVVPVVLNSMITGMPFGRRGTDLGAIDTGKDDKNGRPISIDLLQLNLVRRALRITGGQAVIRGLDEGKSVPDTINEAASDIIHGIVHPWAGPPARAIMTALTGKTFEGYNVAKDDTTSSRLAAAAGQVNPIIAGLEEGKGTKEGSLLHLLQRYGSIVGIKSGKFPTHEGLLEKEQNKKVGDMDIGERLLAEKEHQDKVKEERMLKAPDVRVREETQAGQKAIKNMEKRGTELMSRLDKADRQWLESRGLILKGFDNKVTLAKQKMYLTEDEMARYTDLVKENTSLAISSLREDYDSLPEGTKEKYFQEIMTAARKQAGMQLKTEMVEKSVPKKKRKRFSIFRSEPVEGEGEMVGTVGTVE